MDKKNTGPTLTDRMRRRILLVGGGAVAGASLPSIAIAQAWPSKPIRIVAAQAPGSSNDATARALAEYLAVELKTPVVVENKPGGLGMIAADVVARSAPDGYTFLITLHSQLAQASVLLKKAPIDPSKDLTPIGAYNTGVSLAVVKKDLPVTNLKELVALAKKRPVSVGNYGIGSGWQMMVMQLAKQTGGQFDIVNYKGTGPMALDLMAGNIDMGAGSMVGLASGMQRGSFRPIVMIQGNPKNPLVPGVPDWAEEGYKGPAFQNLLESNMVLAPSGIPAEVVRRLGDLIRASARDSERVKAVLSQLGVTDSPTLTGPALKDFIAQTWPAFQGMTRELNIVVE
ncbi:tripartite tricarboxylate transporter substrate binding protein [Variovorax sp. E3]|uniref:Bug family tripartite tricarboxylate transporter substrate binding protein n=1 Tax=Variovorax sp. E3 TaxID=1914993 RepID=UPI0018DAFA1B|nr:tripartite tricarboxylate transporter substrate binding protein [Variovorax sp. E3]